MYKKSRNYNFIENYYNELIVNTVEDFKNLDSVTELKIGASLTEIPDNIFNGSTSLTSIDFSQATNLKTIGQLAFYNCTGLTGNS